MPVCDVTRIANGRTAQGRAALYLPMVEEAAERFGVPLEVVIGVIRTESNWNPVAVSSAGAIGLMQLMPATGRGMMESLGIVTPYTPTEPELNITLGTHLLARLHRRWGNWPHAFAAYFAGGGNLSQALAAGGLTSAMTRYVDAVETRVAIAERACREGQPFDPSTPSRPSTPSGPATPSSAGGAGVEGALLSLLLFWASR